MPTSVGMSRKWSLILAVCLVALGVMPSVASAARSFDKRFGANDNGGITMAANTLMSCAVPPATCGKEDATPNQTSNSNYDNNEWDMVQLDMDGDSATTRNSSTATLNLPAGAEVLWPASTG